MAADYSSFGLQDKVAIVTGASQGIGRAIAVGLATAGAHVVVLTRVVELGRVSGRAGGPGRHA